MPKEITKLEGIKLICSECCVQLPEFDENGRHNFCPASKKGEIVQLCMPCKLKSLPKGTL